MIRRSDKYVTGFSKFSKREKLDWINRHFLDHEESSKKILEQFWLDDSALQRRMDGFSENTISNYLLPFSIAPNFQINDRPYALPMVIEESSVVAAASASAKYWKDRGGIQSHVVATEKVGQIHLTCSQEEQTFREFFRAEQESCLRVCGPLMENMIARGGGLKNIELLTFPNESEYYQVRMTFETCDSMGANFINSILETFAKEMLRLHKNVYPQSDLEIIMCILSNYTPDCRVIASVSCPVKDLGQIASLSASIFAQKFEKAVRIAHIDPYRATTHNKGIYNGIDAVIIATGNDFRAVESCGHAYAARDGTYRSLTHCTVENDMFKFWIDVPMALGTVGGLTNLHPMAKLSLKILGQPTSKELMMITASAGLMQNFGAIKSLVSTGIQQGHMKMHLSNVLYQLKATENEFKEAVLYFKDKIVSHRAVQEFLNNVRNSTGLNNQKKIL